MAALQLNGPVTQTGRPGAPSGDVLTVYAVPVSLYCAKLRILLRHKGLAWEEVPPPGGYGSDAYKQIVPSGNLPALVDGDLLIADSEAIAEYLNEKHPEPPMLPDSLAGRARARERSRFHDTRLEPAVRALYGAIGARSPDRDLLGRQGEAISARLAQFARMLEAARGDAPVAGGGPALTLGDCGYPVTFAWIEALEPVLRLSIDWPDAVLGYRDALARHAAVAAELAGYCATLDTWLEARATA